MKRKPGRPPIPAMMRRRNAANVGFTDATWRQIKLAARAGSRTVSKQIEVLVEAALRRAR